MSDFKTPTEYHLWFDSLAEMEAEMPALIQKSNPDRWSSSVTHRAAYRGGEEWFGCKDAATAMKYMRDGWPELHEKLRPMIDKLRNTLGLDTTVAIHTEVRRRKRHRDDHGDTLDITRVWNGDLEHAWERPVKYPRLNRSQQYATIFADCTVSAGVSAEQTLWRAAAVHCILEVLTRMGVNTEVWTGNSSVNCWNNGPYNFWSGVKVKSFTQPLNEDRLATMLCTVFFRTWGFGTIMAAPWRCTPGLGMPIDRGLVKPLQERKDVGERVFRLGACLNEYSAQAEIQRVIGELQKKEAA